MGDLNFRLDNMSRQEVERAITAKNYPKMLDNDQVLQNTVWAFFCFAAKGVMLKNDQVLHDTF